MREMLCELLAENLRKTSTGRKACPIPKFQKRKPAGGTASAARARLKPTLKSRLVIVDLEVAIRSGAVRALWGVAVAHGLC